jgi:hypothetical protein
MHGFFRCDNCSKKISPTWRVTIQELALADRKNSHGIVRELQEECLFIFSSRSVMKLCNESREAFICIDVKDALKQDLFESLINFFLTELLSRVQFAYGIYPFHASAIVRQGEAYMFMGHPGVGKTTTALQLCQKGFSLLSDDRPLVDLCGNIYAFYRPINIAADVMSILDRQEVFGGYSTSFSRKKKFQFDVNIYSNGNPEVCAQVKKIFILTQYPVVENNAELQPHVAFKEMMSITYPFYHESEMEYLCSICDYYSHSADVYLSRIEHTGEWLQKLVSCID